MVIYYAGLLVYVECLYYHILQVASSFYIILVSRFNNYVLQTLIYFYEPIELEQYQLIEGKVTLSQSQGNHRNLNIELVYVIMSFYPYSC